jgi:hypothetical protein
MVERDQGRLELRLEDEPGDAIGSVARARGPTPFLAVSGVEVVAVIIRVIEAEELRGLVWGGTGRGATRFWRKRVVSIKMSKHGGRRTASAVVVFTGAVVFAGLAEICPAAKRTVARMEMESFIFGFVGGKM